VLTSRKLSAVLLPLTLLALFAFPGLASSSPGAYRVVVVQADCTQPLTLRDQIAAIPGVAVVDEFKGCEGTPTAAFLEGYDLVVSQSDSQYENNIDYGNALADYVDSGGVVVQYAYDNWDNGGSPIGPAGRFAGGGYEPFVPGPNPNALTTLGAFDASSPLMQGVAKLEAQFNTDPTLAPGATLVAKWADGRNAIAYKGRVVSISAYTGDNGPKEPAGWSGDFGRLTVNAVRWLGRQTLTVTNSNPAGGTISGPGLNCGSTCSAVLNFQSSVPLTATANTGFAFAGYSGACTGPSCTLTMDAPKAVTANFEAFKLAKKPGRNKKRGTGILKVTVGGPGTLLLNGKSVKRQTKTISAAGVIKLPLVAKAKARKALKNTGKAKVKFEISFTPSGGIAAAQTKSVVLKKSS
jgi:hypothetical protein